MFLEETSGNPLVDSHSDDISQRTDSNFIVFVKFCLLDSFEEESSEGFKGVLIHLIDDAKLNEQEIERCTFSSNSSVDFSKNVNLFLRF